MFEEILELCELANGKTAIMAYKEKEQKQWTL